MTAGDSRDAQGRYRFFPFTPESHLVAEKFPKNFWYWKYIFYPQPKVSVVWSRLGSQLGRGCGDKSYRARHDRTDNFQRQVRKLGKVQMIHRAELSGQVLARLMLVIIAGCWRLASYGGAEPGHNIRGQVVLQLKVVVEVDTVVNRCRRDTLR